MAFLSKRRQFALNAEFYPFIAVTLITILVKNANFFYFKIILLYSNIYVIVFVLKCMIALSFY